MTEIEIVANNKSHKVISDQIKIFTDHPGLTCIGKDDLYDLGFTPDGTNNIILKINGLTIEITNSLRGR
jgi:hypothetical protein